MYLDDQTPEIGTEATETETVQTQVEETTENPSEVVEAPAQTEETTEQTSPEPQPTPEGYVPKEKFIASAQESILNAERVKVRDAQLEKLTNTDTPTDDAMRQLYGEWDELNDVTKKALIKQEAQEMRQRRIESELSELREEKKLKEELESVIDANPKLSGKESEFKRFAMNPKNKGISADVLAKAFLFDAQGDAPAQPNVQKTEVLPQGSGGSREPLKSKKVSIEEASQIRQTDYKRYMELVKSGMIDDEI